MKSGQCGFLKGTATCHGVCWSAPRYHTVTFLCCHFFLSFELNWVPRYNLFSWNSFSHLQILPVGRPCSFPRFCCFHQKSLGREHRSLTKYKTPEVQWITSAVRRPQSTYVHSEETWTCPTDGKRLPLIIKVARKWNELKEKINWT